MKKLFLVLVLLAFAVKTACAQNGIRPAISIGPELDVPQRSAYNIGYGASVNFELPVASAVSLVIGAGYNRYNYRNINISGYSKPRPDNYFPLKAGVKYYPNARLYLQGDLGTVLSNTNNSSGANSNLFAYALGTGFLFPLNQVKNNMVDVGLRFEDWSNNRLRLLAIRVAYRLEL